MVGAKRAKQRRSEAAFGRKGRERSPDARSTGKGSREGGKDGQVEEGDVGGSYRKTSKAAG